MKYLIKRYGNWCLVAGAGEGLGKAYARAAAENGMGVILVDQNRELLDSVADELEQVFDVPTRSLHVDLALENSIPLMMQVIRETSCRLIIYNAAYSKVQPFMKNTPSDLEYYLKVNMQRPLELIHGFCDLYEKSSDQYGQSRDLAKGIILMSSMAGSWGTQLLAVYGATKAFNHILAESLYHELKAKGFDVLACVAGPTNTPGYQASNPGGGKARIKALEPEAVVKASLDKLGKAPFVVPGFLNKFNYFFLSRLLSRRSSLWIMNRAVGKIYRDKL
jgi:short-subunit dehydrogenase